VIQEKLEFLFFDINSSHHILILEFRSDRKGFSEDVISYITSDEAHQMIAHCFWFFKRVRKRFFFTGKASLAFVLDRVLNGVLPPSLLYRHRLLVMVVLLRNFCS